MNFILKSLGLGVYTLSVLEQTDGDVESSMRNAVENAFNGLTEFAYESSSKTALVITETGIEPTIYELAIFNEEKTIVNSVFNGLSEVSQSRVQNLRQKMLKLSGGCW